jgi:hypothetical protein
MDPRDRCRTAKAWRIHTSFPELRKDEEQIYIYFGMTTDCYDEILNIIKDDKMKERTNYRTVISPWGTSCDRFKLRNS